MSNEQDEGAAMSSTDGHGHEHEAAQAQAAPVVVAVGRDGSAAAVRRGAHEALRRGRGLHLVHAVRVGTDPDRALQQALRLAEDELAGRGPVTGLATTGSVATVVSMLGDHAPVVVTGRHPHAATDPWQVTSTGAAIAAHVRAPVLSVPSWTGPAAGPVVVGLDLLGGGDDLLREAFEAARAGGGAVRLLAARWRPTRGSVSPGTQDADEADRGLADLLDRWGADFPDVVTEVDVTPAGAADALLEAARSASLLVLGRHEPWVPRGSFLGPVARSVLRAAPCPVLVAAPTTVHGARGRAGAAPLGVG